MKFSKLAEAQINKARSEGKLDNLKGAGKPLGAGVSDASVQAIGYGIMSEAGAIPEEIRLRKAILRQKEILQAISDPKDRRQEMKKLADLQMQLAMQEEARRKFFGP